MRRDSTLPRVRSAVRSLAEALRSAFATLGLAPAVARAAALEAWPAIARRCLGPEGDRTRALSVERGTLVIAVPSPLLAGELRLRSGEILDELERRAPEARIRAVRFVPR
jgi:hypothetical protein